MSESAARERHARSCICQVASLGRQIAELSHSTARHGRTRPEQATWRLDVNVPFIRSALIMITVGTIVSL